MEARSKDPAPHVLSQPEMQKRAVLISGASSGIGRAAALFLASREFRVFAGVLQLNDAAELVDNWQDLITPVKLDVTVPKSISEAAEFVADQLSGQPLYGLLNNAGIFIQGPLAFLPIERFREQLEVNVLGNIAVTQAFVSLLKRGPGRIINVGSISGRSAAPFEGAYAASKFALEAITDVLRVELRPFGIRVCIVEPGGVYTPMLVRAVATIEDELRSLPTGARVVYDRVIESVRRNGVYSLRHAIAAEKVAAVIHKALTRRRFRARYVVGADAKLLTKLEVLPTRIRDFVLARAVGLS